MDQQASVRPQSRTPGQAMRPRGGHRDLTKGPILTTLLVFSAPTLASNILQALSGSVNSVWVGRLLGDSALAATANANVVMFLVFAAVFGFGMAATVKVGQAFGAGETDAARRTFGSAVGLCVGLSLVVTPLGWIFTPNLLRFMATPPEIFAFALAYLRVVNQPADDLAFERIVNVPKRGLGDKAIAKLHMLARADAGLKTAGQKFGGAHGAFIGVVMRAQLVADQPVRKIAHFLCQGGVQVIDPEDGQFLGAGDGADALEQFAVDVFQLRGGLLHTLVPCHGGIRDDGARGGEDLTHDLVVFGICEQTVAHPRMEGEV